MAAYEWLALAARLLTYVGTIGAAGSILLGLTLGPSRSFMGLLRCQSLVGAAILIFALPLTYISFQLGLVGGDLKLAFSENFWNIFFQTGQGRQIWWRLGLALAVLLLALLDLKSNRLFVFGAAPAIILVVLFGFEGHSITFGPRWASGGLIITHLLIVHWWFAVLIPLMISEKKSQEIIALKFSKQAIIFVPILTLSGSLFLAILADWRWPVFDDYFMRFLWKMIAFVTIISIAAANKYFIRPGIYLRVSLGFETFIALAVLVATIFLVKSSP